MAFDPLTAVFEAGKLFIERKWPDPAKQAEELRKLEELRQTGDLARLSEHVGLMRSQIEVNKVEAAHKSLFVAGWRPAVGWVCVSILAFNYIGVYLLEYAAGLSTAMPAPPERLDMDELWPVLLGLLGIGAQRSYDKRNGTQTDRLGG